MKKTSWFTKSICNNFHYLLSDYKYKVIVLSGEHIQFYSDLICLRFTYEQYSGYINVIFSHLDGEYEMALEEFSSSLGKHMEHYKTGIYAYDHDVAKRCITKLSTDIKENLEKLITGNKAFYGSLFSVAKEERDILMSEYSFGALRNSASDAWQKKDFKELLSIYHEIGYKNLTKKEKRRKLYSEKIYSNVFK